MQLQQGVLQFAHALPAYENIKALGTELAVPRDLPTPVPAFAPSGAVVFRAVTYRHKPDDEEEPQTSSRGVRALDLTIDPGMFLGVRGPSGSGKTTFADLLVGLLAPQSGEITVGGAALRGATLSGWRETISYVSQDPLLFHDTVRRNLLWASPGASEDDLWRALRLTGAEHLVRGMALGLDTVVGDRGILVSGGERQRIALAGALLRKPSLLVLDEATCAVDIAGEHEFLLRLRELTPRPTVVMIAHRPESLALCDQTITLEGGRLWTPVAPDRRAVKAAASGLS